MFLDVLGKRLISKSLCPSAQQYLSQHYNLHSMYGYFEAQVTNTYELLLILLYYGLGDLDI